VEDDEKICDDNIFIKRKKEEIDIRKIIEIDENKYTYLIILLPEKILQF